MRTGRRLARSLAFQTLFEMESRPGDIDLDRALANRVQALEEESETPLSRESVEFAVGLVQGACAHRDEVDDLIARAAPAFPLEQMALTDRVSLELAVFEMLFEGTAPLKVVINEAVELAKTYGGENSGRFVNGVLGTIAGERTPEGDQSKLFHSETETGDARTKQNVDHSSRR